MNLFDVQAKHKGKSGILAGLGQMADGTGLGSNNGISADNLVGGAAKVTGGVLLGLGKLTVKGVKAGMALAKKQHDGVDVGKEMGDAIQGKMQGFRNSLPNMASLGGLRDTMRGSDAVKSENAEGDKEATGSASILGGIGLGGLLGRKR
jgi:hypothetical protein